METSLNVVDVVLDRRSRYWATESIFRRLGLQCHHKYSQKDRKFGSGFHLRASPAACSLISSRSSSLFSNLEVDRN